MIISWCPVGTWTPPAPVYFADIEKISPLCKLELLEDGGSNIEYRCVKYRDCPDCKNSDESEKISLREEAEEQRIRDSVKLDIPNMATPPIVVDT